MNENKFNCSHCGKGISHRGYCKLCESAYKKARYDPIKAHEYYLEHKEHLLPTIKEYAKRNKEQIREYQKAYRNIGLDDSLMKEYKMKYN